MAGGERVVRDPIYGYVEVPRQLIGIIDHPLLQRLRRVSQTSLTGYVYPSATGTRFEHALGVMYLADRAWTAIWGKLSQEANASVRRAFMKAVAEDVKDLPKDPDSFGRCMRLSFCAAALLHDVGHPPFSHALEEIFRTMVWPKVEQAPSDARTIELEEGMLPFHEFCGRRMAESICRDVFRDPDDETIVGIRDAVSQILGSRTPSRSWSGALHGLISGEIDIDRIDYLIRDSHKAAGAEFGSIDYIRLLDALELHFDPKDVEQNAFRIAPVVRARSAVETLLIQRLQTYEYIHYHPRVVGFNLALRRALESFLELSGEAGEEVWRPDSIERIFRHLKPNLVYWDALEIDAVAALGMGLAANPGSEKDQTSILEPIEDTEQFVSALKDRDKFMKAALASVDDGLIIETLKRAFVIAGIAPPGYAVDALTKKRLSRFRTYSQAALFRRKNFVPAWKSVDEYVDAAIEMRDALLEPAPARLLERAEQASDEQAKMLRAIAGRMTSAHGGRKGANERTDAVIALNTLMDLILFRPTLLEGIRDGLNRNPSVGEKDGVWEVAYTGTGPVKQLEVELYAKDKLVSLADRSPLTEAVWLAEERRMKLAVFFFFDDVDFSDPTAGNAGSYRQMIREAAVERLPSLVLESIDEYV